MRWFIGVVVVCATLAHGEETHRQSAIALRMSVHAGGGFIIPEPQCYQCGVTQPSTASFSGALELAVVFRSRAGEGYFANQLVWYPIFDPAPRYALSSAFIQQMLALTAEVGFLGRVENRVLFGGGALAAFSFTEQTRGQRASIVAFGFVPMPGLSMRLLVAIDTLGVHRVGLNLAVLVRLSAPGVIALPTLSYSATLPW